MWTYHWKPTAPNKVLGMPPGRMGRARSSSLGIADPGEAIQLDHPVSVMFTQPAWLCSFQVSPCFDV